IKDFGAADYYNLNFNPVASTFNLTSGLKINGSLTIPSPVILDPTSSSFPISVAGTWNIASGATFVPRQSTVTFDGATSQSITGTATFYAMRDVTSGATLQFTVNTTQYVTGMIEMRNISLVSSASGATWYLTVTGSSRTFDNLHIRDSNASNGLQLRADNSV